MADSIGTVGLDIGSTKLGMMPAGVASGGWRFSQTPKSILTN
ncbi:hypothetical protein [Microcoleus anatoxicus]